MTFIPIYFALPEKNGYIAGTGDGIVTVMGKPASRGIHLYEVGGSMAPMILVARQASSESGHYLFTGLDPAKRYLVMVRDLLPIKNEQRYEPAVWDYVTPATDLTIQQQQELWQSWQTQ